MYIWHYSSWHWAWSVNLTSIQTSKVQLSVKLRSTWRGTFAVLVFTKYVPFFDCLVTIYSLNIDNFPLIFHAHVHLQKPLQKGGTLMMTGVFLLKNVSFNPKVADVISPVMEASPEPHSLYTLAALRSDWAPIKLSGYLRAQVPLESHTSHEDFTQHLFHVSKLFRCRRSENVSGACVSCQRTARHKKKKFLFYGREQPSATGSILGGFWWWVPEND